MHKYHKLHLYKKLLHQDPLNRTVYEDEYDNALRLLERNQMIPEQLRYCPHCGSDEIKFVLKKSHRVRAVVAAVIAALSAAPPGTEHWEYVCRKCGTHFEKPVAKGTVEE